MYLLYPKYLSLFLFPSILCIQIVIFNIEGYRLSSVLYKLYLNQVRYQLTKIQ